MGKIIELVGKNPRDNSCGRVVLHNTRLAIRETNAGLLFFRGIREIYRIGGETTPPIYTLEATEWPLSFDRQAHVIARTTTLKHGAHEAGECLQLCDGAICHVITDCSPEVTYVVDGGCTEQEQSYPWYARLWRWICNKKPERIPHEHYIHLLSKKPLPNVVALHHRNGGT